MNLPLSPQRPSAAAETTRVLMSDTRGGVLRPFARDVDVKLSSRGAPWDDALVVEVNQVQPAEMSGCFPERPTVVLHLDGSEGTVERITGRKLERMPASVGTLDFDPAGERTAVRWTEPHNLLCLMPSPQMFQRALVDVPSAGSLELMRANHVRDPQIENIGQALMAECANGFASGRLFGEALALALVSRLVSNFSARKPVVESVAAGGIPLWRLRQVTQYVEDNLGYDICIADLAKVAEMSDFHFTRMFKQSTGVTPYRYILQRRIQRARELLARSAMSLHEVAAHAGFGDQAHLSTVFKKTTGMTPKQFRDQAR